MVDDVDELINLFQCLSLHHADELDKALLLKRIYNELPDDLFELIIFSCRNRHDGGGLNSLRLASKRLKGVVEACTTVLAFERDEAGPAALPIPIIKRCKRIEEIVCWSQSLRSLEGCPGGLKRLRIGRARRLKDISPLASCSMMESLEFYDSSVTDISAVASMTNLQKLFFLRASPGRPSIKDLDAIPSCVKLKKLWLLGCELIADLSPLSSCPSIETLYLTRCPLITSLDPLVKMNLKEVWCHGIHPDTALLPLAICAKLAELRCDAIAVDLEELREKRPNLKISVE